MGARFVALSSWLLVLCFALPGLSGAEPPGPQEGVGAAADAGPWLEAPLRFHVTQLGGEPVADAAFVERQLAAAARIFAPHRVRFRAVATRPLNGRHARLVSRGHRDALASYVQPGAIDVFVVERLMDVDEPGRLRCGVHWRPRHAPEKRLVVVRAGCMDDVLAHELGHYLGLQRHSDVPGNLMSYARGETPVAVLDARQVARVREVLGSLLAERSLTGPPFD